MEDFTTYTKVDPNSRLTVIPTRVTCTNIIRNESTFLYKDRGAGHFNGDFSHKFAIQLTAHSSLDSPYFIPWMLSNSVGSWGTSLASSDFLTVGITYTGAERDIELYCRYNNGTTIEVTDLGNALAIGITYYCTISRTGAVVTLRVYTDSGRTSLLYTLTATLAGVTAFRYIYGMASRGDATYNPTASISGYCENLDLGETVYPSPSIAISPVAPTPTSFSEATPYLQGVCTDGTYVYVSAVGSGYPGKLLKYSKTGTLQASRQLGSADNVTHISALNIKDGYIYLADITDVSENPAVCYPRVVRFRATDLSYVDRPLNDIGRLGYDVEQVVFYNNFWWITSSKSTTILKYDASWNFVKVYTTNDGLVDTGGTFSGFQGMAFIQLGTNIYMLGTTHEDDEVNPRRLTIYRYSIATDKFTLLQNYDNFADQGISAENIDGSSVWFADRVNATIYNRDVRLMISTEPVYLSPSQSQVFSATVSGGTPPYTVRWYDANNNLVATGNSVNIQFPSIGTFLIHAVATDVNNATSSPSNIVTINVSTVTPPSLSVNISATTPTTVYVGDSVTFVATPSGGTPPYTYQWYDGQSLINGAAAQTQTVLFPTAGTYSITVIVHDAISATATSNAIIVNVNPLPIYTSPWSLQLESGTYKVEVPPQATINGELHNFAHWEDNSTNNIRTLVISADTTINATFLPIVPPLVVDAGGPYSTRTVYFAGSASGGTPPYSWHWDFGDGTTSTLQNPTHTYATAGNFTATLTVTDGASKTAFDTASVTITALLPPLALFTYMPANPVVGQVINFNGSASHPQETGATITNYSWNFGDGATATGVAPTHVYALAQTYNVVLTVTDSLGSSDTETMAVSVSNPPTWTLIASASNGGSISPSGTRMYNSGQASEVFTFIRNKNYIFDGWIFDANNVGTSPTYQVPAQTAGSSHTLVASFTPASALIAHAGGPYSGHITTGNISFQGSATGGVAPYFWQWTFGDGGASTLQNPAHIYTSAGVFNVLLTVTDTDGNQATEATTVTISNYLPPTASFTWSPPTPTIEQNVNFNGSASTVGEPLATIMSYDWDFGDGTTGSGVSIVHAFNLAQQYSVKLTVTDTNQMSNSITKTVTVNAKPKKRFIIQSGPNGSTNPSPAIYDVDYDVDFSVTAVPNPHHKFSSWNVDGSVSDSVTQLFPASESPVSETHTLTAYFEVLLWTLSALAGPHGSVQVFPPTGTYLDGTEVQISAVPESGFIFDYMVVNGSIDHANPLSLVMDKDYAVTAYFILIPTYTIGGTVQDATGMPVVEVRVSAENTAYSTYTLADGSFILPVEQGSYTLVFEKAGYATVKVPNVAVNGNMQVQPVTISPIPFQAGFPWYIAVIAVPITALIFWGRPKHKGAKK